jgi:hypothetical protein
MKAKTAKLTRAQREAIAALANILTQEGFYLAGGVGLALQLDHRESQDLDWFRSQDVNPQALSARLTQAGIPIQPIHQEPNTLYFDLYGVPSSALRYGYRLLSPLQHMDNLHCNVAAPLDIACMKLSAIVQRVQIKDYYDLAVLAQTDLPLLQVVDAYRDKFDGADPRSALMALTYFDDVASQASAFEPLRDPQRWAATQQTLTNWVQALHRDLKQRLQQPPENGPNVPGTEPLQPRRHSGPSQDRSER